jgi:hypothetical protein
MNAILGFALFFSIIAALFDTYYYTKRKWQTHQAASTGGDMHILGQRISVRKPRELLVMILVVFIILSIFFSR